MIELSVGLPIYKSLSTIDVALEGLARQEGINFDWELLVAEEKEGAYGEGRLLSNFREKLARVRCKRILYLTISRKLPLSRKWKLLGENTAKKSICFLLQAADCYSQPLRLQETLQLFKSKGCDWVQSPLGYFYHVGKPHLFLYNKYTKGYTHSCGLNMAISSLYMRFLPDESIERNVDGWLFSSITKLRKTKLFIAENNSKSWRGGIDIDGRNHISHYRYDMLKNGVPPFSSAGFLREALGKTLFLPKDIAKRMLSL